MVDQYGSFVLMVFLYVICRGKLAFISQGKECMDSLGVQDVLLHINKIMITLLKHNLDSRMNFMKTEYK